MVDLDEALAAGQSHSGVVAVVDAEGTDDGAEPEQMEEQPVHAALAVEDGVGQFDGAQAAMTVEEGRQQAGEHADSTRR